MGKKEDSYPIKISGIIEAAFLVVFAQNANMIAIPIVDLISNKLFKSIHFILLTVPLINMTAIIANWLTCKIYEKVYDINMLIEDIITLGVFYLEVYIINKLCDGNILINEKESMLIIGATYSLIFILFIFWNRSAFKNTKSSKKRVNIRIANIQNIILLGICMAIFILALWEKCCYAFITYCFFVMAWVYIWIFHGHRNKIASFLVKRRKNNNN